jgi:hypothetical protein
MATPRRRSSSTGFSSESIDESSDIAIEEIVEVSEKTEEAEQPEAKQEVQPLPEIIPTEAPPPMSLKEAAKQEVVPETQPSTQQKTSAARHPRNIPKFSKVRG